LKENNALGIQQKVLNRVEREKKKKLKNPYYNLLWYPTERKQQQNLSGI